MRIKHIIKGIRSRLTFFDYLSLIFAAGVILFLVIFFQRKVEWVEVKLRNARASISASREISVGACERDGMGRKIAEVLKVERFERPKGWESDLHLRLKLQVVWDRRKKQYLFRSKPLGVGSYLKLNLSGVLVEGYIKEIEGITKKKIFEDKIVEARLIKSSEVFPETLGVMPWVAEAIKADDQMRNAEGEVVAEVLEKKVEPAKKIIITSEGRVFVRKDPIKKDVTLKLKLKTTKQGEINYFLEDVKVKVNEVIPLYLTNISIYPVITKILN